MISTNILADWSLHSLKEEVCCYYVPNWKRNILYSIFHVIVCFSFQKLPAIRRCIDTSPSHQSSNNLFLSDCCVVSSWLYTCFHHDGLVSSLVDCCVMFRGRAQWCYHLSIHLVHHIARTIRPPSPNYINQLILASGEVCTQPNMHRLTVL